MLLTLVGETGLPRNSKHRLLLLFRRRTNLRCPISLGTPYEQRFGQDLRKDASHPGRHDVSGGRVHIDVDGVDRYHDACRHNHHNEQQVLACRKQNNQRTGRWDQISWLDVEFRSLIILGEMWVAFRSSVTSWFHPPIRVVHPSVHNSTHPSFRLSFHWCIYPSIHNSIGRSFHLSVHWCIYPSIYKSFVLWSIYLAIQKSELLHLSYNFFHIF